MGGSQSQSANCPDCQTCPAVNCEVDCPTPGPKVVFVGYVPGEDAFCIGNAKFADCTPIPYKLDIPDANHGMMRDLALSRAHTFYAIANHYGFTFNVLDASKLSAIPAGTYPCAGDKTKDCGCNDGSCKEEHGARQWAVYHIYA